MVNKTKKMLYFTQRVDQFTFNKHFTPRKFY